MNTEAILKLPVHVRAAMAHRSSDVRLFGFSRASDVDSELLAYRGSALPFNLDVYCLQILADHIIQTHTNP